MVGEDLFWLAVRGGRLWSRLSVEAKQPNLRMNLLLIFMGVIGVLSISVVL